MDASFIERLLMERIRAKCRKGTKVRSGGDLVDFTIVTVNAPFRQGPNRGRPRIEIELGSGTRMFLPVYKLVPLFLLTEGTVGGTESRYRTACEQICSPPQFFESATEPYLVGLARHLDPAFSELYVPT